MFSIDLNCDLGESFGKYIIGNDQQILKYVSSVSIACGFHAGDPVVIDKTVKMALEKGVAIGAHPGYPDLMGFGRREMSLSLKELRAYVIYQLGALQGFLTVYGGKLQHVKPHGALYNQAAVNYDLAYTLVKTVKEIDPKLIFLGLTNSMMEKAAKDLQVNFSREIFADRAYNSDGTLVFRDKKGALIDDPKLATRRVIRMIKKGVVTSIEGKDLSIKGDSICLHGDNDKALKFAKLIRESLLAEDIIIRG